MIPILDRHDQTRVLGRVFSDVGGLHFELINPVTRDQLFNIFGNAGIRITECGEYVTSGTILEFSNGYKN